jgi:hypothetical protein
MCRQRTSSLKCYVEKGHRTRESRRTEDFNEKAEEQKHLNKENFTSEEAAEKGCVASVHQACNFMLHRLTHVAYCDLPQLWDTATARAWACDA